MWLESIIGNRFIPDSEYYEDVEFYYAGYAEVIFIGRVPMIQLDENVFQVTDDEPDYLPFISATGMWEGQINPNLYMWN